MELNIKHAFLSPFLDEEWYIKLIFPITISIFTSLLDSNFLNFPKIYSSIPSIILFLLLSGFYTQFQHNEIHNETPLLPTIKSKYTKYLKYGFFVSIISFLYIIANAILLGVLKGIFSSILLILHFSHMAVAARMAVTIFVVAAIIFSFFAIAILLIAWVFALCAYADTLSLNGNIIFSNACQLMSKVKIEILVGILISAILSFPLIGYTNISLKSINVLFFIVPIIQVYVQLLIFNLAVQVYKIAKNRLKEEICKNGSNDFILEDF